MSAGRRQEWMVVLMDDSLAALNRVVSLLRARQCEVEALSIRAADPPTQRLSFRLVSGPRAEQVARWLGRCQEVRQTAIATDEAIPAHRAIGAATPEGTRDQIRDRDYAS